MALTPTPTVPDLRLVDLARGEDDPIPFERRMSDRRRLRGQATVLQQHTAAGQTHHRIASADLRDMSETGLGLIADEPICMGAKVSVMLPSHGPDQGIDMRGRVVRCEPNGAGRYHVGVLLHGSIAAAC